MISGVLITPADYATKSPIDLLIASPGACSFLSQTLYGPTDHPNISFIYMTFPLDAWIHSFSSGKLGLWSIDKASTENCPLLFVIKIAQLSPVLKQVIDGVICCKFNMMLQAVVPAKLTSNFCFLMSRCVWWLALTKVWFLFSLDVKKSDTDFSSAPSPINYWAAFSKF